MITSRSLLLFGFLALLSGCGITPCVAPSEISELQLPQCYYRLQVTAVDIDHYRVTAIVPKDLRDRSNDRAETPTEYIFHVSNLKELEKVITPGKTYSFMRENNNSPYLKHFANQPKEGVVEGADNK